MKFGAYCTCHGISEMLFRLQSYNVFSFRGSADLSGC
jgi:hypothetical protein